jgi:hypothetical protein
VCGGIVNGVNLGGICVKKPVITLNAVGGRVNTNLGFSAAITNNGTGNNTAPYDFIWQYGDGTGATVLDTNVTSDSKTKAYTSVRTYDVSVRVVNSYGVSATVHRIITISAATGTTTGTTHGSGGGGSSSAGPLSAGILKYQGKNTKVNLGTCKSSQAVYADYEDVITFVYNGETYTLDPASVTNKSVDFMLYPQKQLVSLMKKGSTIMDVDGNNTDDVSIIINDIIRDVDPAGFVRHKINMTLNLVNCPAEEKAPAETVKEVLNEIKSGVINVIGDITPANKASPIVGSAITVGIIAVGLGGYFATRKRKPKL